MKPIKQYNGKQWTEARMRSFVMSAIRSARWPQKWVALDRAYISDGTNPATGHKCKLHKCEECGAIGPKGLLQADHTEPVVPLDGKCGKTTSWLGYNFNELLPRLFCEAKGFGAICKPCHKAKTEAERATRKQHKEA
jgi:hypothetical protein